MYPDISCWEKAAAFVSCWKHLVDHYVIKIAGLDDLNLLGSIQQNTS